MHLYEQLLGASFSALPAAMQDFHRRTRPRARGTFSVRRAPGWFAALAATAYGLPQPGEKVAVVLDVSASGDTEYWCRRFGSSRFDTVQRVRDGKLLERSGLFTIVFAVRAGEAGMSFASECCTVAGFRIPAWLGPSIEATATGNANGWSMEVRVSAPRVGLVESYGGDVVAAS